jgi:hypothetical protein
MNSKKPGINSRYPFLWFTKLHWVVAPILSLCQTERSFIRLIYFGGTLFRKFKGITRHKTIWDGRKLMFIFETAKFNEKESLHDLLKQLLEPYQCDFHITYTERIGSSPSGKHSYMEIVKSSKNE